jgi:hypothetical protein
MADVYNAGEAKIDGWVRQISAKIEVAKKGLAEQVKQLITMLQENLLKAARKVHSALLHLLPMSLSVDLGDAALRELTVQLAGGADVSIGIALGSAIVRRHYSQHCRQICAAGDRSNEGKRVVAM